MSESVINNSDKYFFNLHSSGQNWKDGKKILKLRTAYINAGDTSHSLHPTKSKSNVFSLSTI